ncbi:MAG: hypothetical protein AAFM92_11140 [Pseudomonadota bacterium]
MRLLFLQFYEGFLALRDRDSRSERAYLAAVSAFERSRYKQTLRHFDNLNSKAAALLTHISVMIAVTAFVFYFLYPNRQEVDVWGWLILSEMVSYILLTLPCVAPLYVTNFYSFDLKRLSTKTPVRDGLLEAYVRRRNCFYISYFGCILFTIFFALTVLGKLLFGSA